MNASLSHDEFQKLIGNQTYNELYGFDGDDLQKKISRQKEQMTRK